MPASMTDDAVSADARLVRLCAEFDVLERQHDDAHAARNSVSADDDAKFDRLTIRSLLDAQERLALEINQTPANTPRGLCAKLRSYGVWDKEILKQQPKDVSELILASACRDALNMASGSATKSPRHAIAAEDSVLVAMGAQFAQANGLVKHVNRFGSSDADCDTAIDKWSHLVECITNQQAKSSAGVQQKALVLREVLRQHHTRPKVGMAFSAVTRQEDELAWSLVHDILGEETPWPDQTGER